jgi:hypothetical protein
MTEEIKQEETIAQEVKQGLPVDKPKQNANLQKRKIIVVSILGFVAAIAISAMIYCLIKL